MSAYYDSPASPEVGIALAVVLLGIPAYFLLAGVVLPPVERLARRLWLRYGESIKAVALAEVGCPALVRVAVNALGWLLSAVRWLVDPKAETRRRIGRYLLAKPAHSGLTTYEEYEAEIEALPSGAARLALRGELRAMRKPSREVIEAARKRQGRCVLPPAFVRCLLRGEKPCRFPDVV